MERGAGDRQLEVNKCREGWLEHFGDHFVSCQNENFREVASVFKIDRGWGWDKHVEKNGRLEIRKGGAKIV